MTVLKKAQGVDASLLANARAAWPPVRSPGLAPRARQKLGARGRRGGGRSRIREGAATVLRHTAPRPTPGAQENPGDALAPRCGGTDRKCSQRTFMPLPQEEARAISTSGGSRHSTPLAGAGAGVVGWVNAATCGRLRVGEESEARGAEASVPTCNTTLGPSWSLVLSIRLQAPSMQRGLSAPGWGSCWGGSGPSCSGRLSDMRGQEEAMWAEDTVLALWLSHLTGC
ncbi:hypothetical protein HPG69_018184 [Diceros bicornis minor]|uniref:Uncharacterized protein n=1 Tax=Diceros bicornis minor TaxID=77932 RepID=A0A7J7FLS9_DICBM|nr:hypothetical protein HPG69_018184 [Diceros bicornis minor]